MYKRQHQHHLEVHRGGLAPVDYQRAANALRALAVIALVALDSAGRFFLEALGIFGPGNIPGPPEGRVVIGGQLVPPHDEIDLFVAVEAGGHPVAGAVDIDDLAGLGQTVDRRCV